MPAPATASITFPTADPPSSAVSGFSWLFDLAALTAAYPTEMNAWWAACTANSGLKVRFYEGATELDFDVIGTFDTTAKTGLFRVYAATFTATSQDVTLYTSDTGNGDFAMPTAAYDSGWAAYVPMQVDETDRLGNSWSVVGDTAFGTTGKFGKAATFDGADDAIKFSTPIVSAEPMTLMCWANNPTAGDVLISINNYQNPDNGWRLAKVISGGNRISAYCTDGTTANAVNTVATLPSAGTWWHGAAVFTSDSSRVAYLDGAIGTENTTTVAPAPANSPRTEIGRDPRYDSQDYVGDLQDAQIHSVARSSDWIAAEFSQTNDNASFWGSPTFDSGSGGGFQAAWASRSNLVLAV